MRVNDELYSKLFSYIVTVRFRALYAIDLFAPT